MWMAGAGGKTGQSYGAADDVADDGGEDAVRV